ncbi:MAG: S8 family serine peptidase [Phycisphaerae bacterium]|nr:S8 family serine peptidase [Phycisphaerae bacterium]
MTAERQKVSIAAVFFCALFSTLTYGLHNSTGPNGSNVQDVWTAGTGYTGQGVAVGLISQDHARLTHEAFAGIDPNNWYDATGHNTYTPSWHDTPVGGIICSRGGAAYPNDKGAAPDAELYTVKVVYDSGIAPAWIQDALDYLVDPERQCQVVVTGIALYSTADPIPDGNSIWSLIYDYYAYQHNMVFATASGNFNPEISVFGDTYNSITTGGLFIDANDVYHQVGAIDGSGSNAGPTHDGRKKPDIVAPSQKQWFPYVSNDTSWIYIKDVSASYDDRGQTSWAVPHTGGVAAVLLEYANESAEPNDDQNEVIKAVIVNSALPNILDKSGNETIDRSDPNWPLEIEAWNTDRGYGRIDAKRAYDILSSPGITTTQSKGWTYDSVASGQPDSYIIKGAKNKRLVLTLTWNRRVIWTDQKSGLPPKYNGIMELGEIETFLADLDLEINDPNGIPIPLTSSDKDNLEKFDLLLSKTGNYEIKVVAKADSESANYALAFELLDPLEADFNIDYVVNEFDLADFSSFWLDSGCDNSNEPCFPYNLNGNDTINLVDFSIVAQQWLTYDNRYYSP